MKKIIVLFSSLIILSCNFNANISHDNEESEKEAAESTTALFYLFLGRNDFKGTLTLFNEAFYKISSQDETITFLNDKRDKLGDLKSYILKNWKTHRSSGTKSESVIILIYQVNYSKGSVIEKITLTNEKGIIKICGYDIGEYT